MMTVSIVLPMCTRNLDTNNLHTHPLKMQVQHTHWVGQNRIHAPYMTEYLVIPLPKHHIYTV